MHTAMLRGIAHQWLLVGDDAQVVEMLRSFRERAARDYPPTRTKPRRTQKP